jgi:hypothetical protein
MIIASKELNEIFTRVFKNRKTRNQVVALATHVVKNYDSVRSNSFNSLLRAFNVDLHITISAAHVLGSTNRQVFYFLGCPDEIIEKINKIEKPKAKKTLLQHAKIAFTKFTKMNEQQYHKCDRNC